jgi:oligopeptide/dipeptide ABC transporter ATP-binding protein
VLIPLPIVPLPGLGETCKGETALKATGSSLLQIECLTVTYSQEHGTPVRALENINLSVAPREIVGVLGESGCGKSTLANAVVGLLARSAAIESGRIAFKGVNLLEMSEAQLPRIRGHKISVVPQEPALALNPVMTAGAQIAEVLNAHLRLGRNERKARVLELLGQMGFDNPGEVAAAYPHQLSGGQRQRVVLAQAIACEPELLIADEPTSKLDAGLRTEIASLLSQLHRKHGMAILLISHDVPLVASLASQIVLMYSGRVVESSPRADMVARPLHPYGRQLLELARSSSVMTAGVRPTLSVNDRDQREGAASGCCFEPRCGERMSICAENAPRDVRPEPARTVNCFKYGE